MDINFKILENILHSIKIKIRGFLKDKKKSTWDESNALSALKILRGFAIISKFLRLYFVSLNAKSKFCPRSLVKDHVLLLH